MSNPRINYLEPHWTRRKTKNKSKDTICFVLPSSFTGILRFDVFLYENNLSVSASLAVQLYPRQHFADKEPPTAAFEAFGGEVFFKNFFNFACRDTSGIVGNG